MACEDRRILGARISVIRFGDERISGHPGRVMRRTVEETFNAVLDSEAEGRCNAGNYERTAALRDSRPGHYE
jgi:hypothetical protein